MLNIGIIPARKGSKGIVNKNLIPLCGIPLVEHSIRVAIEVNSLDYVVVSSDSEEILDIACKFGNKVIPLKRPEYLSTDFSPTSDVVLHATNFLVNEFKVKPDYVVLLQPTSPYRTTKHIEECLDLICASRRDSLISVSDPIQHPFDFVYQDGEVVKYLCRTEGVNRRQDFKAAKFINGSIYITSYNFLVTNEQIYNLDNCVLYDMPVEFSIDIDTKLDLILCEAIMNGGVNL
jgi:CMP-N-acetylneuraminic acid synthetase